MRSLMTVIALLLLVTTAPAANLSFTGAFTQDDDVQLFTLSIGAVSNVTLRTWSYAGGTNAAGASIGSGGFDPILTVFDSTGAVVGANDDGGASVTPDPVTNATFDSFLDLTGLAPGLYTVALTQFDNFAAGPNLSNGFVRSGQGNFTPALSGIVGCTQFCDVAGGIRDGDWAVDILNVDQAEEVPRVLEPATMTLLGAGLAAMSFLRRRKRV